MAAQAIRSPRRRAPLLPDDGRRLDRGVLGLALTIAGLIHLAALLLPLPERTPVSPPAPPPGPIVDISFPIPPPPVPDAPVINPAVAGHLLPVPFPDPPSPDPVAEPRPPLLPEVRNDWVPELAPGEIPPPPAASAAIDESVEGLVLPIPLPGRAEPDYPELAREIRAEGVVKLRAQITPEGDVAAIEVIRGPTPDLGFRAAAVDAVSTWKYVPGRFGGRPVAVMLTVVVEFRIR